LLGRYFSKIRKFIIETCQIQNILLLPFSVFEATVGFSVVYLLQRKKLISQQHKITARFATTTEDVGKQEFKQFAYPQSYFLGVKHNRFRLFFEKETKDIISKVEVASKELRNIVRFNSGLIGKNGQQSITSKEQKSNKWLPGIISGSEIGKYWVHPKGNFILYDKAKIKSGYENVDYFLEKLLMRQTGDKLTCAFDDSKLLVLNNIHVGNLIDKRFSLKYIAALLNSTLLNFYYKSLSLETGRVMAQTDIETIESLPIKHISESEQNNIIQLVNKILAITKDDDYLENSAKQAKVREYEKQIDQLVYKLYGLTDEEIKIVEGQNDDSKS
jgi:hypothetical protein